MKQNLLNYLAEQAATQLPHLTPENRARLCDGLALILPGQESGQARFTAALIRRSLAAQTEMQSILQSLSK